MLDQGRTLLGQTHRLENRKQRGQEWEYKYMLMRNLKVPIGRYLKIEGGTRQDGDK